MKELLVISGKGGTGKTSIAASFAVLADGKVLADCDVDAADLHLLLEPSVRETHEFYGGQVARITEDCQRCGLCEDVCRFDAISDFEVNPFCCEGCGLCYRLCPHDAIVLEDELSGHWYISDTAYGPLVHAKLGIAQENSGKLVTRVRRKAAELARDTGAGLIITDGPPGTGCPVIASISGVDLALMVTEPSIAGFHDLRRAIEVARGSGVQSAVCINKWDLDEEKASEIEEFCSREGIDVVGRIPFDPAMTRSMVDGSPVVLWEDAPAAAAIREVYDRTMAHLSNAG